MDLRNFNGFESEGTFTLRPYKSFFSKIVIRSGKMHHVELNSGTSKSGKLKILYTFEDIDNYESPMQSYIKDRVKPWEQIEFKG